MARGRSSGRRVGRHPAQDDVQQLVDLDLGQYASLTDTERIVGNLYRAYSELDGLDRGCQLDDARCFADMMAYNGGQPLRCLA